MVAKRPSYQELAALVEQQAKVIAELRQENQRHVEEIERFKRRVTQLEEEVRTSNRQAAPFRRREELKKPPAEHRAPGRRPGHQGTYRQRPAQIDQTVDVPLSGCPHCQGELRDVRPVEQFIEELPPVKPVCVKVVTWTGVCACCGQVRSTHPLQTSTATGAAGNHLGPRALALAVMLSHRTGLTMGRVCQVLRDLCGLKLSRGGLAQLLQRAAGRCSAFYDEILEQIRHSAAVFADETSWYVGGPKWWLWIFTTPTATLYRVEPGRGQNIVHQTLGTDFSGMLVSDCLSSYDPIDCKKHKCIAHHLRALKEQEASLAKRGLESHELLLWKVQLQDVIITWQQREKLGPVAYAKKVLQLTRGIDNLLSRSPPEPEEAAFRNRLRKQRDHLLGCLQNPAAEPTNNRAERDLRPAVIDRKLSCGNKTTAGKHAWEILRSVVITTSKQGQDILEALTSRLRLAAN